MKFRRLVCRFLMLALSILPFVAYAQNKDSVKLNTANNDIKSLIVEDITVGKGKPAAKGKRVRVNYTGWLYDATKPNGRGQQLGTSIGKAPYEFELGSGELIRGWDEGIKDMKSGGRRKLLIPSDLAYGKNGAGAGIIPPGYALVFEIELVEVL